MPFIFFGMSPARGLGLGKTHPPILSHCTADTGRASAQEQKRRELAAGLAVYAAKARLAAAAAPGHRAAPLTEEGLGPASGGGAATADPLAHSHPSAAAAGRSVAGGGSRDGGAAQAAPAVPRRGGDGGFAAAGAAPGGSLGQAAPLAAGLMNAAAVLQSSFVKCAPSFVPLRGHFFLDGLACCVSTPAQQPSWTS